MPPIGRTGPAASRRLLLWAGGAVGAALVLHLAIAALPGGGGSDAVAAMARQARDMAKRWHRDARLVSVQISGYGFDLASGKGGAPLRSDNTPKVAWFYFASPEAGDETLFHVSQQFNPTPEQKELAQQRPDFGSMRATEMPNAAVVVPWRGEIPPQAMSLTEAVALAQKSGIDAQCRAADPHQGCANITRAELHMYIVGRGEMLPIWRVTFGPDGAGREVTRLVDAKTRKLITNCGVPSQAAPAIARENLYLECR